VEFRGRLHDGGPLAEEIGGARVEEEFLAIAIKGVIERDGQRLAAETIVGQAT
jgi:hypothetical protein